MDTGKLQKLQGGPWGNSLSDGAIDWRGDTLLVKGDSAEVDSYSVYEYKLDQEAWSASLGVFPDSSRIVQYMPAGLEKQHEHVRDFIVLNEPLYYPRSDLWRYRRPEGVFERLTDDRMPKQDVTSYHGKREGVESQP